VSGVKREFHAPFWEGLGVKVPRATRPEPTIPLMHVKVGYRPSAVFVDVWHLTRNSKSFSGVQLAP